MVQLGGGSLINGNAGPHLGELLRIVDSNKIHIFVESERAAEGAELDAAHAQFLAVCAGLNIHARVSERRATENYLEESAIQKVFDSQYKALGPFDVLRAEAKPWPKADNWKIARAMDFGAIKNTDLGEFLESL